MFNILRKNLIKPSSPTPLNLKNYHVSCTDMVVPQVDVPIILFYSSTPHDHTKVSHLKESLANILPKFYPFAGRYLAKDHLIDCSDQGVQFIEVEVADDHLNLFEFIKDLKPEQLSNLLPQKPNSLLCIQVTTFKCGGVAIGVRIPHILIDGSSLETFIATWANANNNNNKENMISPVFYSPPLFPNKNLDIVVDIEESRSTKDPDIVAKMFSFDKEAIASLKAKITGRASRVRVVCTLIVKALIRLDRKKRGMYPRDCQIFQTVNIRHRTIPPLPKHSCGNFFTFAASRRCSDNIQFEELVELLGQATGEIIKECATTFSTSEGPRRVVLDPFMNLIDAVADGETNVLAFSDWTKFRFYDADFGWGKPVWTSIDAMFLQNQIILVGNKEGDGIEAWVHLSHQDMAYFEKDEEIRSYIRTS